MTITANTVTPEQCDNSIPFRLLDLSQEVRHAMIGYFNKFVLLVGREFAQEEIDAFERCLYCLYRDRWIRDDEHQIPEVAEADANVAIPTLYTSPGLYEERSYAQLKEEPAVEIVYIIVVRGRSAALYSKVRIFYSRYAVAAALMEETLQGNSVVFTAAILKQDVLRLQDQLHFRKVASLGKLREENSGDERTTIPICC